MSLDLLNTEPESAPKEFIRGQTLEFVMELPKTIPAGFFANDELRSRAVLSYHSLGGTPQFQVLIKHPDAAPILYGAPWNTDEATTCADLADVVNAAEAILGTDPAFVDKTLTAAAIGNKIYFTADKTWADMDDVHVQPPFDMPDPDALVRNCLQGGGTGIRAKASFILLSDITVGTTVTLSVNGHTATYERQGGDTLIATAAGLAADAMASDEIAALVTVTNDGERVILTCAYEGALGNEITYTVSSDSGANDCPSTLYGGVNGAEADAVSTVLSSKLRLVESGGTGGFIADLNPTWEPGSNATKVRFYVENTDDFPVGPAEFDVVFIRTVSSTPPTTKKYRSLPIKITIKDGVT